MLGIAGPGVRGEVYAYEPMEASGGGWTVVHMDLEAARGDDVDMARTAVSVGG
jgi:hypothetical protein